VEELDPERLSFFNVNTEEDLDRARELAAAGA
jgi:molybdopterin-guanine dinucleotide biosynthesis protein A